MSKRQRPARREKVASPRWQITLITIGAIVVVAAGIIASFTVGGGHFFTK